MYYMWINKNLVYQVGEQTKVILRCTVNQPSRHDVHISVNQDNIYENDQLDANL
jgi:hypothetical protein